MSAEKAESQHILTQGVYMAHITRSIVRTDDDYLRLINMIKDLISEDFRLGFDFETTGLDFKKCGIVGASFGFELDDKLYGYYVPVNHQEVTKVEFALVSPGDEPFTFYKKRRQGQVNEDIFIKGLIDLFSHEKLILCCHNFTFDFGFYIEALFKRGLLPKERFRAEDSMVSSFLIHKRPLRLKKRVEVDLGYKMSTLGDVVSDMSRIDESSIKEMGEYCQDDAIFSPQLIKYTLNKFRQNKEWNRKEKVFTDLEGPTSIVLTHMERTGFLIDKEHLNQLNETFIDRKKTLVKHIHEITGMSFNITSSRQISDLMYNRFKYWKPYEGQELGEAGYYGCDKHSLNDIIYYSDECCVGPGLEIAENILKYRMYNTLIVYYTSKIPKLLDEDNRVHCRLKQCATVTGRLASSSPNLQNIPARSKEGAEIRNCFISEDGWSIVAADYSQAELRMLAHMSQDPNLTKAYIEGIDVHTMTSDALGVDRKTGKAINFMIVYGGGAAKLARQLKVSVNTAREYIDNFLDFYSKIKWYKDAVDFLVRKRHFTYTITGRTRYYHEEMARGKYWLNRAINHPIQGSVGDIVKMSMRDVYYYLRDNDLLYTKVRMLLQVHDEIIFEVKDDFVEEFKPILKHLMENTYKLKVPLEVDVGVGKCWSEAH
tara:strand:+ start:6565 stop:8529 length:1965 start_codon:yes stop_codon:yes gene_type:complete